MPAGSDLLDRLKSEHTRNDALDDLKRFLSDNDPNIKSNILYNCISYIASHTYHFTDRQYEELASLAISNKVLTTKQKSNIESWIDNRDDLIEEKGSGMHYVPYDGPDDIDRYLGHGEFDDDAGYYVCD
ncbi:2700_t:CDS:1 [Funneliformis geosporum]|uniref:5925_t:CDS:1 n=1 Tax=Funneliformis geosporum TaxID=1117311 RepID=A0A9W4SLT1_9GLOM|nr:2700_t:CDS:1 [Funneliformis geosporum]CAI2173290.1 5925_t:CDS:1 [Funneliformis geosporum]